MLMEPDGHDHSKGTGLENIYQKIYQKHPELQFATPAMLNRWYQEDRGGLTRIAQDYFKSGVGLLADYQADPEIQELGLLVKRELRHDNLKIALANGNFATVLRELGVRVDRRFDLSCLKSVVLVQDEAAMYGSSRREIMVTDARHLLAANRSPLLGIKETIERASEIRDAVSYRELTDSPQRISNRALAYAARFFHGYLQVPQQLEIPEDIAMLTDIYSPKFLDQINYQGMSNFQPGDGAILYPNHRRFKLLSLQG